MKDELRVILPARDMSDERLLRSAIAKAAGISPGDRWNYRILKRSLDARSKEIRYQLRVLILDPGEQLLESHAVDWKNVQNEREVHIIGSGPAGLFCALQCIQLGLKPVLFERGKNVRDRRRDLAKLNKEGILNEESNYCFGEGGAGTYSDGKLYTRSHKRGDLQTVLKWLCHFGADASIQYDAHPHIGTNKLPAIIEKIRLQILDSGGEIHFESKFDGIINGEGRIKKIRINGDAVAVRHLVLATGHSASDVYELLHREKIAIESKPFALGVRVEHPQALVDKIQFRCNPRPSYLPAASYSLVEQVKGRGVFSFCMCPGGIIAPASTRQGCLVVNGWSPSKRNNPFANSGIVVSVDERDYDHQDALAGLQFQQAVEQKAFIAGGGSFRAPAQRLTDFVENKLSASLPECSYVPGIQSAFLSDVLPNFINNALQEAFILFGRKMPGYYTREAVVVATESRTSSPVRIPRLPDTLQHSAISNLYPCAEGAGYAGGIVSAAMDGMKVAEAIVRLNEHAG